MSAPRNPAINWLQSALFNVATWLLRVLPDRCGLALMRGMGSLGYLALGKRRRMAMGRLEQALGIPADSPESRRIVRGSCQAMSRAIFESWFVDGIQARRPNDVVTNVTGLEELQEQIAKGRGVLLVCSHFSSFLMPARILQPLIGDMHTLARTRKNAYLQRMFDEGPMRFISERVGMEGAVQSMLRWLRDGKVVTVFVDQRARRGAGDVLDFLGMPARHQNIAGRLAARTGAALMPMYCQHTPGEVRYELTIEPTLEPDPSLSRQEAETDLNRRLSDSLSARVTAHPDHYMLVHDRWRGQVPEGAPWPGVPSPPSGKVQPVAK